MTQETSDLTVKKEGAIMTLDFEADSGMGLENIEKDDLALPFLKLLQSGSYETKKKHASATNELKKMTKILNKHRSGLREKIHPEVVSHEVRQKYNFFNSTSGRIILGVGAEVRDDLN